jgi:GTPase
MTTVFGDLHGLKKNTLVKLDKLSRRKTAPDSICSAELAEDLCEIALEMRKALTIIFDRKGRVTHVVVGDAEELPRLCSEIQPKATNSPGALDVYCLHTHFAWEAPTPGDTVTLLQYRFPIFGLLMAGTAEGFSQKRGVQSKYCDGCILLHGELSTNSSDELTTVASAPLTIVQLEQESREHWWFLGESVFEQRIFNTDKQKRVLLIGLDNTSDTNATLNELEQLASTLSYKCVGSMQQKRSDPDPKFYFGKGKLQELAMMVQQKQVSRVIVDDELTPTQVRTMEQVLRVPLLDRTELIITIFAHRAQTREGTLQVELARLQYLMPRLLGRGHTLSQQSAGAKGMTGSRGPGETKLEVDRRTIRERVTRLEEEVQAIVSHRRFQRQRRERTEVPVIALVGYTNAGKSTLLNRLTGADVLAESKLFATLDTTTRQLYLPTEQHALLSDTVGFIQKLPTKLVQAFQATLEEVSHADLLLHVWDMAHPNALQHLKTVEDTLVELDADSIPRITICNKVDLFPEVPFSELLSGQFPGAGIVNPLPLSATTGQGCTELLTILGTYFDQNSDVLESLLPPAYVGT